MTLQQSSHYKIRLIYGIVLSLLITAVGVCLIVSCLSIYRSGESPFTPETIADRFSKIAVPVFLCLGGIVVGAVLAVVMPSEEARPHARVDMAAKLKKRYARLGADLSTASGEQKIACTGERRKRTYCRIVCGAVCVFSALPLVIYLCDPSHFTPQLNESILAATYMTLPFILLGGVACYVTDCFVRASLKRELKLAESIPTPTDGKLQAPQVSMRHGSRSMNVVRIAMLAIAAALILLGIFNGGMRDVLGKAIKICTECIGLG